MVEVSSRAVRSFRLHRLGLAGGGHADPLTVARTNLFVQAQIEGPALLGLSQRLAGRPTQAVAKAALLEHRQLVRSWGPRDTVHLFEPARWPDVVAARAQWGKSARPPVEFDVDVLRAAYDRIASFSRTFTRSDLRDLVSDDWIASFESPYVSTVDDKWRFAAGRYIWHACNDGLACHAGKKGSEQEYAPRAAWFPELPDSLPDPKAAATALARDYLASYGPATVQDLAHFFGGKVSSARGWVAAMVDVVPVRCEGRELVARAEDVDEIRLDRPMTTRLLPGYDNLLMGHADKSWTIRKDGEEKAVWRKAAVVAAVVLDEGTIVATWTHTVKGKRLEVTVEPLSGWSASLGPAVAAEAEAVARHLGGTEARVVVQDA